MTELCAFTVVFNDSFDNLGSSLILESRSKAFGEFGCSGWGRLDQTLVLLGGFGTQNPSSHHLGSHHALFPLASVD